jgi:DNA invertase Pin-like site-specific DNA recombinase
MHEEADLKDAPKWLGYLRVSTRGQADNGGGLGVQEDEVRRWVKARGGHLVGFCEDRGVSGADEMKDRPGLAMAMYKAKRNGYAGIVVYRLDRLARDAIVQEMILREFTKNRLEVHSTSEEEDRLLGDSTDPSRALIRTILGAVYEYDRKMITLRMQAGIARKRLAGQYCGGTIGYGFRPDPKKRGALMPVRSELDCIAQGLTMREMGASFRTIGEFWATDGGMRLRRAMDWHPQSVKNVLERAKAKGDPEPAVLGPLARQFMGLPALAEV